MSKSPEELAHLEWLGYVQPVGLIVSIPAMLEAQCYVNKNIMTEHAQFLSCLPKGPADERIPELRDLPEFTRKVLGWEAEDLLEVPARAPLAADMAALEVILPQYNETLRPNYVVWEWGAGASGAGTRDQGGLNDELRQSQSPNPQVPILLIQQLPSGISLDEPDDTDSARHWNAAPQAKFERLLRESGVPIGLLSNGRQLRLVYAPKGESSGHATFNVAEMMQVAGRPMFAALHMLLCADRLFSLGDNQRLPAILHNSRKYQNTVSTKLAEQVLAALYELMRGFQAANDVRNGDLLRDVLATDPNHVYAGLLRVLMRLVFVMYAEDRDLLSSDPIYSNYYSVTGLFNRLREDAGRHPDTMNQRYGAWSQLITLFRLIYEGGQHGDFKLPARKGYLFDPDRYPFLEGRDWGPGIGDRGLGIGGQGLGTGGSGSGIGGSGSGIGGQGLGTGGSGSGTGVSGLGVGGADDDGDSVLSGSERVAVGDGADRRTLSNDEIVSEGGDLRSDQPDPSGSQFDSSEHRGGSRKREQGIPAISENRSGQPDGIGNTSDDRSESRHSAGGGLDVAARQNRTTRSYAEQAASSHKPLSPNPQPPGPNPHPLSPDPHPPTPNPQPPIPRVSDGVVYKVLRNLLILDGERLSYRTLDVEQIGSVYETVMGFNLEVAKGRSIAIKPVKSHGAPATINLTELLKTPGKDRAKWLKEHSDQTLGKEAGKQLKDAESLEQLLEALDKKIAKKVTPRTVAKGAIVLQPSDERRRSGSHYTPRSLTEPIVRTTLEPILKQLLEVSPELLEEEQRLLARNQKLKTFNRQLATDLERVQRRIELARAAAAKGVPHPRQILELKICDPAMGSGAFLVEACRQLAEELVKSWYAHCDKGSGTGGSGTGGWGLGTGDSGLGIGDSGLGTGDSGLGTGDSGLGIGDLGLGYDDENSSSPSPNSQTRIPHPQALTPKPQAPTPNPQTLIPKPQPPTPTPFPAIPPDEDEVLYARRLVAQRCLYGVDKNEMAVDLAKLSLWLVTLAKDHPFTFLDHSLRHGDSLVGLTRKQIIGFHWEPKKQKLFGEELIQERLDRATKARAKILNAREDVPYRDQEQRMALADEALNLVRLTGDACVSAFFAGKKAKEREQLCAELFDDVARHYQALKDGKFDVDAYRRIADTVAKLRGESSLFKVEGPISEPPITTSTAHPIPPFHWEVEFPEVFSQERGGFDAIVGNPPFLGGTMISSSNGLGFKDWLYAMYTECGNRMDLVAYFLRRAFELLRQTGAAGLIATNSIAQGDTRSGGLLQIRRAGADIYSATRRMKWPGDAAVVVSVVHFCRQPVRLQRKLDGKLVQKITAFLFHDGSDESPEVLKVNTDIAFEGVKPYGQGFIFDDHDTKATPLADLHDILKTSPHCQEVIFPYISGEEINDSPTHEPRRQIINFGNRKLETCLQFGPLIEIVESKVKPERMAKSAEVKSQPWWLFFRSRPEMMAAIKDLNRVLVVSRVGDKFAFTFISSHITPSEAVVLLALEDDASFAVLQSRIHETWARFFGSSMKDDLRYTPTDCFLTFPFPDSYITITNITQCGFAYFSSRAATMIQSGEGLTKTYNRFHDPHEKSPDILKLRELHDAMDRAVLEAYGWHDLAQTARCEFLLDYEEEGDGDSGPGTGGNSQSLTPKPQSRRRKPYRLRWPDDFRDEVLARLLELNEQRHKEELLVGKQAAKPEKAAKPAKSSQPKKPPKAKVRDLFSQSLESGHRYLLMLLRAWNGRAVTRRVLNAGLILMLDDKLRASLVSSGKRPAGKRKAEPNLNQIFTELAIDGFIEQVPSDQQQLWRVTSKAPTTDDASPDDVSRVTETMQYLNRAQEAGTIKVSEEIVDAEVDLIPA